MCTFIVDILSKIFPFLICDQKKRDCVFCFVFQPLEHNYRVLYLVYLDIITQCKQLPRWYSGVSFKGLVYPFETLANNPAIPVWQFDNLFLSSTSSVTKYSLNSSLKVTYPGTVFSLCNRINTHWCDCMNSHLLQHCWDHHWQLQLHKHVTCPNRWHQLVDADRSRLMLHAVPHLEWLHMSHHLKMLTQHLSG